MDIDTEKVDEAALAILYLTLHDRVRAWKGWIGTSSGGSTRKGLLTIQSVSRSQWCSLTPAFARHSAASANSSARGDVVRRSVPFVTRVRPNHAFEPTAASGLRALAVPSALRASAAAQRER